MRNRSPNATLYDLGKYDMLMARCPCGHRAPVLPSNVRPGFNPRIVDLPKYLWCEVCKKKGLATVWVMTR
jgi:hypothetical protein